LASATQYKGERGMDIIWEIGFQAIKILTLVVGILGVTLSLLLLFAPNVTKTISKMCNRYVDIDQKINYLDKDISTESLIYRHNIISGSCLIVGSAFTIAFLFYSLDVKSFVNVFFGSQKFATTNEVIFSSFALLGKMAGIIGLIIGSILLFNPGQMRSIENKMNTWFTTQSVFAKLDQSQGDFDSMIYQRPLLYGSIGLITSILLTVLALTNML
jgi:hypothetical protein